MKHVTIDFEARCSDCDASLDVTDVEWDGLGAILVQVQPCSRCKDEAYEDGREQGYSEGYDEGKNE